MGINEILKNIEAVAIRDNLPIIDPIKADIIRKIIHIHKPRSILEIGALVGYSSIVMASVSDEIKITTIEIDESDAKKARNNIQKAKLENRVEVIQGDALEVIPKLSKRFDMIFIDAKKSDYLKYLILAENHMNKKHLIIADNVGIFANKMKDYLEYVRNSGKYKSKTIETTDKNFRDAIEISIKI